MSRLISSASQTRLSIAVTIVLAGLLVLQMQPGTKAVPEKQKLSAVPAPPPARMAETSPDPVFLPPPPAPEIIVQATKAKSQPEQSATSAAVPEVLQPLITQETTAGIKPVDPLAGREALKPRQLRKTIEQPQRSPASSKPVQKTLSPQGVKPALVIAAAKNSDRQPVHYASPQTAGKGRALLRILEHGKGPDIRISWPDDARSRIALSKQLRRCFGMQLALMDGRGQLFVADSQPGTAWRPNRDYYSGFVRQTAGQLPPAERSTAREIRRQHGPVGAEVHIFPRRVDALVLGALQNLVGPAYGQATTITARYDLAGPQLRIRDFRVDGQKVQGVIDLSGVRHCRGSNA